MCRLPFSHAYRDVRPHVDPALHVSGVCKFSPRLMSSMCSSFLAHASHMSLRRLSGLSPVRLVDGQEEGGDVTEAFSHTLLTSLVPENCCNKTCDPTGQNMCHCAIKFHIYHPELKTNMKRCYLKSRGVVQTLTCHACKKVMFTFSPV